MQKPVRLERLFDEIRCPLANGGDGGVDIAVAGDHQHRNGRIPPLYLVQQFQAIEPGTLQPDVQQHQRRAPRIQRLDRAVAVRGRARGETLILQDTRHQIANVLFIVDYQNIKRHWPSLFQSFCHGTRQ